VSFALPRASKISNRQRQTSSGENLAEHHGSGSISDAKYIIVMATYQIAGGVSGSMAAAATRRNNNVALSSIMARVIVAAKMASKAGAYHQRGKMAKYRRQREKIWAAWRKSSVTMASCNHA